MDEEKATGRLAELSPSRREIALEIPASLVEKEYDKILDAYAGRVKIPGFRKGHAPRAMVKNLFDHEIRHDVYDAVVPRSVDEQLEIHHLHPVNVPEIRDLKDQPGQPLRCTVAFEVMPAFELPDTRDIRIPRPEGAVGDAEVEKALDDLRARAAEYLPVEGRGVADGDYVVAEIQGRDLETRRMLPAEKAVVLAGKADNEPTLNENLAGMKAGEERRFQVSYPPDAPNRRLAGKNIEYRLKVTEIKEKRLPDLGDEFAKSLGDFAGLGDLRGKVRRELEEDREKSNRSAAASEVLKEIARRVNLELPESLIEKESLAILKRLLESVRTPRLSAQALEEIKARARQQAVEQLTNHLILEKIAAREGIQVSEQDIELEIRRLAQANKVPVTYVTDAVNREGRREELRETILLRKTVDFLAGSAIIS